MQPLRRRHRGWFATAFCRIPRDPEPTWHRTARRDRQRARGVLTAAKLGASVPVGVFEELVETWFPPLCQQWKHITLQKSTREAMRYTPRKSLPLIRIDLYCDGSGFGAAPYGFSVIEHYIDDTIGIAGAFGANVSVDNAERDFIGTNCRTNGTSELTAITIATLWALQRRADVPMTIWYDAMYANEVAAANWCPKQNLQLVKTAMSLRNLTTAVIDVDFKHIKSHSDHPWNDLADSICTAIVSEEYTPNALLLPENRAAAINGQHGKID